MVHSNPHSNPALGAYVKLMRAAETITRRSARHLATHQLTLSQFGALEALYHLGPMCQKEIGTKLLKSGGNITTVLDNLERRGLVARKRSTEDRRYILVHLTETGKQLIGDIFPPHAADLTRLMEALSPKELATLGRLCRKLGRSAEET